MSQARYRGHLIRVRGWRDGYHVNLYGQVERDGVVCAVAQEVSCEVPDEGFFRRDLIDWLKECVDTEMENGEVIPWEAGWNGWIPASAGE